MRNQVNNSQSTAAVNSANITLSAWSKTNFAWKSMEINDETFNSFKLSSSLFMFLAEAMSDSKINTCFILKDSSSQKCGYYFCLSKNDDGYIVVTEEWSGSDYEYYMGNKKRFTDGNIGIFADRLYDIIADYYYGIYEAEAANNAAEVSEAPCLDEAPSLEEWSEITGLNEDYMSLDGLKYLRETMVDADMEDIVDEAYEEVSNDLYVWLNELFRSGECPKDEFMDTMWTYAWDIIRDRGLSDEALEAETRYYVEFDDIVERRLEEWGLYERYNKIYMERAYSNR